MTSLQQSDPESTSSKKGFFRKLPKRHLDTWLSLDVYGHLIRACLQPLADIHDYARCIHGQHRDH